jgi:hypothetical protein
MTPPASEDSAEQALRRIRTLLGLESKAEPTIDQPPTDGDPGVADLQRGMADMRGLLQRFGTALGAAGTALMAGLGYTQIHKIFPLPVGSTEWLLILALAGSTGALVGAAWLVGRFFAAQRRIVITSEQFGGSRIDRWRERRRGFNTVEARIRDRVFTDHAQQEDAASLRAVELRSLRLERVARRATDAAHAESTKAESDRLTRVVRIALVRAAAEILERRSQQVFKGPLTAFLALMVVAGIISLFGLADWSQGQRDLVGLRQSCAEAEQAGATNACETLGTGRQPVTIWLNDSFRRYRLSAATKAYRVYGGGSARIGQFVTKTEPTTQRLALAGLALPPGNAARCFVEVRIPAGTLIERGRVGPSQEWPGGWSQIVIEDDLAQVSYFNDEPLPPAEGHCP